MTWRLYSIDEEPLSEEIEKILKEWDEFVKEKPDARGDPWHTYDHDFKDDRSAPWYRAIYHIYFYENHTALRDLIKAGDKPPEEILPHIDELFESRHFVQSKGGRPRTPSILRKSEQWLRDDYQLDYAARYAEEHGTTLKALLAEEAAEANKTKNKFRKETIQRLIAHWENRWTRKSTEI